MNGHSINLAQLQQALTTNHDQFALGNDLDKIGSYNAPPNSNPTITVPPALTAPHGGANIGDLNGAVPDDWGDPNPPTEDKKEAKAEAGKGVGKKKAANKAQQKQQELDKLLDHIARRKNPRSTVQVLETTIGEVLKLKEKGVLIQHESQREPDNSKHDISTGILFNSPFTGWVFDFRAVSEDKLSADSLETEAQGAIKITNGGHRIVLFDSFINGDFRARTKYILPYLRPKDIDKLPTDISWNELPKTLQKSILATKVLIIVNTTGECGEHKKAVEVSYWQAANTAYTVTPRQRAAASDERKMTLDEFSKSPQWWRIAEHFPRWEDHYKLLTFISNCLTIGISEYESEPAFNTDSAAAFTTKTPEQQEKIQQRTQHVAELVINIFVGRKNHEGKPMPLFPTAIINQPNGVTAEKSSPYIFKAMASAICALFKEEKGANIIEGITSEMCYDQAAADDIWKGFCQLMSGKFEEKGLYALAIEKGGANSPKPMKARHLTVVKMLNLVLSK